MWSLPKTEANPSLCLGLCLSLSAQLFVSYLNLWIVLKLMKSLKHSAAATNLEFSMAAACSGSWYCCRRQRHRLHPIRFQTMCRNCDLLLLHFLKLWAADGNHLFLIFITFECCWGRRRCVGWRGFHFRRQSCCHQPPEKHTHREPRTATLETTMETLSFCLSV